MNGRQLSPLCRHECRRNQACHGNGLSRTARRRLSNLVPHRQSCQNLIDSIWGVFLPTDGTDCCDRATVRCCFSDLRRTDGAPPRIEHHATRAFADSSSRCCSVVFFFFVISYHIPAAASVEDAVCTSATRKHAYHAKQSTFFSLVSVFSDQPTTRRLIVVVRCCCCCVFN